MDRAPCGEGSIGKPAPQALTNFPRAPAGVLALHVEDEVFDLKGQLVGVAIRPPAAIGEPLKAALLIPIDDLIAGLARDPKRAAQVRHRLARQPPSDKLHSLVYHRTLPPGH